MTDPLPSSPTALTSLAPTRQFQTSHSRAQFKMLAGIWLVLLAVLSALCVITGAGPTAWASLGTLAVTVVACFLASAMRRNAYGLYVAPDKVATWGFLLRMTVDNGAEVNVRWVEEGDYQYFQLRKRRQLRKRVTYLGHVREKGWLRRFYPAENQLLERVPGSGWKPTGVVWTDDGGADVILDWLGITRDTSEHASHAKMEPKNPVHPDDAPSLRELRPVLIVGATAFLGLCVAQVVFDSNWVLKSIAAAVGGLALLWCYKQMSRISNAKKAAREAREGPDPSRAVGAAGH